LYCISAVLLTHKTILSQKTALIPEFKNTIMSFDYYL